jgi:hypothetical protein
LPFKIGNILGRRSRGIERAARERAAADPKIDDSKPNDEDDDARSHASNSPSVRAALPVHEAAAVFLFI